MRDRKTEKKQTDQEIKYRIRTDDEAWSGKCICSQAIHFPIPHPSHLFNLPPLQTRCIPQCVQLWCHFHLTRCSYLWCHWKMTKLEPQQNFLFHTPQAENCPLFLLLALFYPFIARPQHVHSLRSMPDLSILFTAVCTFYSEYIGHMQIIMSNSFGQS